MEGLEVSETKKSELERTIRIDSEFYSKENLKVVEILTKHKPFDITKLAKVSDGNHMSIKEFFSSDGVPYYRGGDIYNFFIEQTPNPLKIPKSVYNWKNIQRSHLKKGDVLVSIVGAIIGNLSLVTTNQEATCSCKLAILRPNKITSELLAIFLKCEFGQSQIQKFRRGTGQTGLILEDFDQILVPSFGIKFALKIEELVIDSFGKIEDSLMKYAQAETILLETVGLKDFKPTKEPTNIKSFKNSFLATGRLDAEYYQKKYEAYLNLIKLYQNGYEPLSVACNLKDKNHTLKETQKYKYIELSNIGNSGEVTGCSYASGAELPSRAKRLVNKNDVIISSIEGSLQSCAYINNEYDNTICSTGFYVINSKKINSETLLVLFKSELMQNILKQNCSGTILTAINKDEFLKIPIPIIEVEYQEQIAGLVQESFRLKAESERLLEVAKQAVEMAIEEGEEKAVKYLHNFEINKDEL
ncbi:MAG: restriction endonuclease subunit S [Bacteroidota bacterium]|nr:restriction endonuclease subunit S [Bacteroidota bacterium]